MATPTDASSFPSSDTQPLQDTGGASGGWASWPPPGLNCTSQVMHGDPVDKAQLAPDSGATRLLLIEDDPDQQLLIGETLEDAFGDGLVDICGTCAAVEEVPDLSIYALALVDVNLPDGNGLDMLDFLQDRAPELPVMMLTGENDSTTAGRAIRGGACDYVVKAGAYLETMPLTIAKNLAAGETAQERQRREADLRDKTLRLSSDLADEKSARELAEREASTDAMTGCYNRRSFERIGGQLFAEASRKGTALSLVMIDLDKFKQVNDTLGHAVGDDLIRTAARSIQANLRQMDAACRYGGDEFILVLPQTQAPHAAQVAGRIAHDFGQATAAMLPDGEARTMSIGVAELQACQPIPASIQTLMEACDRALYNAKEAGRNRVCAAA